MGSPRADKRVRFVQGLGFEMQCNSCGLYVTLDDEATEWYPKAGLTRCLACWREFHRMKEAGYRSSDIARAQRNTRARLRYAMNREGYAEARRKWRDAHRAERAAYQKDYYARNAERLREKARAYYAECREAVLIQKREYHERRKAA